jgi:hypothetical protein
MKYPRETSTATAGATAPLNDSFTSPVQLDGTKSLRARLMNLRENPELANRALAIAEAGIAVTAAEKSHSDPAVAANLVYLADRKLVAVEGTRGSFGMMDRRPPRVEKRNRDDGQQQKMALSTWEDEGGSAGEHARFTVVASTSDNRRSA